MRLLPPDLEPKLITVLREGVTRADLARDALAGIVVGIVALPLAIAFAIASGARPEQGLFTAIIAGFLISALGGSRVQIGGPTGAFVVIVSQVTAQFGPEGLAVATAMAGVFLILLALARLGSVIRFVPYPVTVGFTSGIALIIAIGQLADGLGVSLETTPANPLERLGAIADALGTVDPATCAIAVGTVLILHFWRRVRTRIPGPLVALVATTAIAHLSGLPVATIGSRFGEVPSDLPSFAIPSFDGVRLPELVSPAISIALLAGIESLLSAVVADGMTGGRHRSNAELLAQGVANLTSPFFGGIPATGAIARTATSIRNGARTPFAGIFHALTLVLILTTCGSLAAAIPLATLAGILAVVAYNMSEWRVFVRLAKGPREDAVVLLTTFALTVAVDLTVAIQVGVVLASLLFMRRMAEVTQVRKVAGMLQQSNEEDAPIGPDASSLTDEVEVFEIHGSFCFGAARKFTEALLASSSSPRVVILIMDDVLAIDATGLHALEDVRARLRGQGASLVLVGAREQPMRALERGGAAKDIGIDNIVVDLEAGLERARTLLAADRASGSID